MAYDQQVSLGQGASAYNVAYITGAPGSVLAFTPVTVTNANSALVNINIVGGNATGTARIAQAYHGTQFAVLSADRQSSIFTANTATANQTVTYNSYNTVTGQIRKLVYLGYL